MSETTNKWKSRRWIINVWAMTLITYVLVVAPLLKYDAGWLTVAIPILCAIPSAYIAGETILKNTYAKKGTEE